MKTQYGCTFSTIGPLVDAPSSRSWQPLMAVVIEMPIRHPARHPNPYHLPRPVGIECPFGCGERFADNWKLYIHLLQYHPENRDAHVPVR